MPMLVVGRQATRKALVPAFSGLQVLVLCGYLEFSKVESFYQAFGPHLRTVYLAKSPLRVGQNGCTMRSGHSASLSRLEMCLYVHR